jgi:predicted AlkP superfamily pyrophosphatase or phosphodiesterase
MMAFLNVRGNWRGFIWSRSMMEKRMWRRVWLQAAAMLVAACVGACSGHGQSAQSGGVGAAGQNNSAAQNANGVGLGAPIFTDHGSNTAAQQAKPYVILVSLDGFRYDYTRKYSAPNISALGTRGASAPEGMIPAYPSVTFPNHYTIVTGLYPEHHGIVGNVFYDPARKQVYSYRDPAAETDGTWYGGTPLWVLAEQQGMRAACFFWPGSEADIQGVRPTYYMKYDQKYPNDKRVEQVLAWLKLPAEQRPHFITLYFSDVDSAGHSHGPDSDEVRSAVAEVDKEIGKLVAGLDELKLPVDLVVLADHGMTKVQGEWIDLDQYFDKSLVVTPVEDFLYPKTEADAAKIFAALDGKSEKFWVYRSGHVPAELRFDGNPREGDPVVVATGPYLLRVSAPAASAASVAMKFYGPPVGMHGYDPAKMAEMKAIFFAAGPDIRTGVKVAPFENVDVYPFVAGILGLDTAGLKTGKIDGDGKSLAGILVGK